MLMLYIMDFILVPPNPKDWRPPANSQFLALLPDKPGLVVPTDTLDFSANYVGDRGLLAVLEIVHRSPQLRRLGWGCPDSSAPPQG